MHSFKLLSALPLALVLAAAPALADAQQHVGAAKKAEHRGDWSKALGEWKAAYSQDVNAEYLIGIGDAYAKLGKKDEAKKNYDAYLSDPLALPANVDKVKAKMALLDAGPGLDLPGSGVGLALPGTVAAVPVLPGGPGLDLPAARADNGRKGKKGHRGSEPAAFPGLDLPGAPPAEAAARPADPGLTLLGLDLPPLPAPPVEQPKPAAAPAVAFSLPPASHTSTAAPLPAHETHKQLASAAPTSAVHTSTAVAAIERKHEAAPVAAVADVPAARASPTASSGSSRGIAFVTAGVALVALGGGAYAYTKASSAHSDLTGSIHDGATAQGLLETEKRNKTISFIGLAGGLVAAGIATALFAF